MINDNVEPSPSNSHFDDEKKFKLGQTLRSAPTE